MSAATTRSPDVPFDIIEIVDTIKYTICRNTPRLQDQPVWYTGRVQIYFTMSDLLAFSEYLPFDAECEWVTREGDDWYFDWVSPGEP